MNEIDPQVSNCIHSENNGEGKEQDIKQYIHYIYPIYIIYTHIIYIYNMHCILFISMLKILSIIY